MWVVTRHQYGISTVIPQTSFRLETSGGVMKCRLFSHAIDFVACVKNSNKYFKPSNCWKRASIYLEKWNKTTFP